MFQRFWNDDRLWGSLSTSRMKHGMVKILNFDEPSALLWKVLEQVYEELARVI